MATTQTEKTAPKKKSPPAVKKNPEPTTAVTAKSNSDLAVPTGSWGHTASNSRDIIIPKILAMQGLSKLVAARKATIGDFVESLNSTKLGSVDRPIEFIPFAVKPMWIIFEEKNGAMKYVKQVDIDAENDAWPYEEVLNGVKIRRDRTLNFYVLLPEEVKAGMYFPYIISFRRTSMMAGKKLNTAFARLAAFNKPPASEVYELCGTSQSNDKGTFIVMDVKKKRETAQDELAAAFQWFKTVSSTAVKVDDSDLEVEAEQYQAPRDTGPEMY